MGYVVGFILAAWLVGRLVQSGWANTLSTSVWPHLVGAVRSMFLVCLAGHLGMLDDKGMDADAAIDAALNLGLYPFVFGDALKPSWQDIVPAAGMAFGRKPDCHLQIKSRVLNAAFLLTWSE